MTDRRFVIPDIHGCARSLDALLRDVLHLRKSDTLFLLGDYIDRGPRSKEVVDRIIYLKKSGYALHTLRGNHEEMILRACSNPDYNRVWMLNGGRTTLDSFGIDAPCDLPSLYKSFFAGLKYYIELDDYILVHAGLNRDADDPFSDMDAMLWSRPDSSAKISNIDGKPVISGHTPVTREAILESAGTGEIFLDNGCVYSSNPDFGSLTALELNSLSFYFQKNID
jgi:serine/threonine protein phosphatase 1